MDKDSINNNSAYDCAVEWVIKLQSPELSLTEEQAFFEWLESSAEHQQAYIDAEKYWSQLGIVEGCLAANDERFGRRFASPWIKSFVAASVLFCAVLFLLQFSDMWDWDTQAYTTVAGERRHLVLDDGSKIIINTDSTVRVKAMSHDVPLRKVFLDEGEALFNVSPDKGRPFVVETPLGAVRVLGTQFIVRAEAGEMKVTVLEGRVALLANVEEAESLAGHFSANITLLPNQQLTIAQALTGVEPVIVDAEALSLWRDGRLIYQGVSLDEVVIDLSRYIDGDIRLADPDMKQTKVIAVFDIADKDSIIKALESALNVVAVSQTDNITLLYPSKS